MPPQQNNLTLPVGPFEIGCDEVGRGPLFGRVYAAAVILPFIPEHTDWSRKIKDSKKFSSPPALKQVAGRIKAEATAYSISFREADHIDRVNILQATQDAMHEAIHRVLEQLPVRNNQTVLETVSPQVCLYVDGNYFRPFQGLTGECVEGGDGKRLSIAAASILAKEARDDWIAELCREHPDLVDKYGLDSNKGYGTKRHIEGLKEHGLTTWHRRSFHVRGLEPIVL